MKLQEVIKQEIDNEFSDIEWKMKNHVPMELLRLPQARIQALEWVIELIEQRGAKGNFELDDVSLKNSRS